MAVPYPRRAHRQILLLGSPPAPGHPRLPAPSAIKVQTASGSNSLFFASSFSQMENWMMAGVSKSTPSSMQRPVKLTARFRNPHAPPPPRMPMPIFHKISVAPQVHGHSLADWAYILVPYTGRNPASSTFCSCVRKVLLCIGFASDRLFGALNHL